MRDDDEPRRVRALASAFGTAAAAARNGADLVDALRAGTVGNLHERDLEAFATLLEDGVTQAKAAARFPQMFDAIVQQAFVSMDVAKRFSRLHDYLVRRAELVSRDGGRSPALLYLFGIASLMDMGIPPAVTTVAAAVDADPAMIAEAERFDARVRACILPSVIVAEAGHLYPPLTAAAFALGEDGQLLDKVVHDFVASVAELTPLPGTSEAAVDRRAELRRACNLAGLAIDAEREAVLDLLGADTLERLLRRVETSGWWGLRR